MTRVELARGAVSRRLDEGSVVDLLHVAAARGLGCKVFVSADDRQLAAAKAAGLNAVDIKVATARSPRR